MASEGVIISSRIWDFATETEDVVDALYQALPKDKQRYKTLHGKMYAVYLHYKDIDINSALYELARNQIEDAVIGRTIGKTKKSYRKAQKHRDRNGPLDSYGINGLMRSGSF